MKPHILESIVKDVGADSAAIMVPDKTKGYLFCFDSLNMPQEWTDIKNSFDETNPGGVAQTLKIGRPAITNHLQKILKGHYIESVMTVPIRIGEGIIAILELVHEVDNKTFTKTDLRVAQQFADQLATKLEL